MADEVYDSTPEASGELADESVGTDRTTDLPEPISYDLGCRRCGYNLRGLKEKSTCPECGAEVGRSLLGDHLRFCGPGWVRTLAWGTSWLFWGGALNLLAMCVSIVMSFIGVYMVPVEWEIFLTTFSLLPCVGTSLVTTREPSLLGSGLPKLRILVRVTMVISIVAGVIGLMFTGFLQVYFQWATVTLFGLTLDLLGVVVFFKYMNTLAERLPNVGLSKQTRFIIRGYFIAYVVFVLLVLALTYDSYSNMSYSTTILLWRVLQILHLSMWLWSIVLLYRYCRAMNRAACNTEETWANSIGLRDVYRRGHRIRRNRV
jgi:hypothetical protein